MVSQSALLSRSQTQLPPVCERMMACLVSKSLGGRKATLTLTAMMYAMVANVVAPARISRRNDESGISLGC